MEFFEPIDKIGHQEVANFVAAVVEDQGAPFLVLADAGIGMLIEMGPIKKGQAVGIFGEVTRHPIEDHPNPFGVAALHKGAKLIRGAKAAGGRIPTGDLITPGSIEGMLGNRHQLDVGEAPSLHVGNHPIG